MEPRTETNTEGALVLATDLDGTLIPLPGVATNPASLETLKIGLAARNVTVIFATGRHGLSTQRAIEEFSLPVPQWAICDVGSSIYRPTDTGWASVDTYADHLSELVHGMDHDALMALFGALDGLWLQEDENQQRFKLSYYAHSSETEALVERMGAIVTENDAPYSIVHSIEHLRDRGQIDLLPRGVSKAYALKWLLEHAGFEPEKVVYAGDSGNDYAALVSGFPAVVVGNASAGLADRTAAELKSRGLGHLLYRADGKATDGLLEGCRHFGLLPAT